MVDLLADALGELMAIQERVDERGADAAETMLAKVAIIHFESPPPKAP